MPVEQIPLDDCGLRSPRALAILGVRLEGLAAIHGWTIDRWEEDGLGETFGLTVRLPSGRILLLHERTHSIEVQGSPGPTVEVEGYDDLKNPSFDPVATDGDIIAEVIRDLAITDQQVAWRQGQEWIHNGEQAPALS